MTNAINAAESTFLGNMCVLKRAVRDELPFWVKIQEYSSLGGKDFCVEVEVYGLYGSVKGARAETVMLLNQQQAVLKVQQVASELTAYQIERYVQMAKLNPIK